MHPLSNRAAKPTKTIVSSQLESQQSKAQHQPHPVISHSIDRNKKAHHQIHRHTEIQTDTLTARLPGIHEKIKDAHKHACCLDTATKKKCPLPRQKRPLPLNRPCSLPTGMKKNMHTNQALGEREPKARQAHVRTSLIPENVYAPAHKTKTCR